jgi:hypothetical protein
LRALSQKVQAKFFVDGVVEIVERRDDAVESVESRLEAVL